MELKKEIKIDFTKQEEEAIQTIINLANTFQENCGESPDCQKCPLKFFCGYNQKIDDFKRSLINFLER